MNLSNPKSSFADVRMRGFRERMDVDVAIDLVLRRLQTLVAESIPLDQTFGRVLAADITSEVAVPSFDRAAMDGFAVKGEETFGAATYNPLEFQVVGSAFPAKPHPGVIAAKQAVRIMTGAPLPIGANAVVPAEFVEPKRADVIAISETVAPGKHVGRVGEDVQAGTVVLCASRMLRPQDLGVLASIGMAAIPVVRRPIVAVFITGDELLPYGSKPEGYRIVDSNSIMLQALITRDGGIPLSLPILPDRADVLRTALQETRADVFLISGGSSVGQEDHAPAVVTELGELCVHGVALRPASPTGIGFISERPVFLLPGNPVSCLCAYELFAGTAIRRLGGLPTELPHRCRQLPLSRKIASDVGRVDYVRVRITDRQMEPVATGGASILSSTTRADGFVLVPRDSEGHAAGETVTVRLYD